MRDEVDFGSRAIDWVTRNLDLLPSQDHCNTNDPLLQKAIVELAIVVLVVRRQSSHSQDGRILDCLRRISEVYQNPIFRERLFREVDSFVPNCLMMVTLAASSQRIED